MRLRFLVLILVVALAATTLSGCATNDPALQARLRQMARTPQLEGEYRVAPPDDLTIEVRGYPEYSRTATVRPDGKITVPSIGDVYVSGKTIPESRRRSPRGSRRNWRRPT